jgi:hypothetical protein
MGSRLIWQSKSSVHRARLDGRALTGGPQQFDDAFFLSSLYPRRRETETALLYPGSAMCHLVRPVPSLVARRLRPSFVGSS